MSMKPKPMRKAVARKKLVSQIINITMYISTVVPNIMLLTATPATSTHTHTHIKTCSSEVLKTGLLCLLVPAAHREAQKSFAVFEDMLCRAFLLSETLSTKKRRDKNILAVIEEEHESEVYWASLRGITN